MSSVFWPSALRIPVSEMARARQGLQKGGLRVGLRALARGVIAGSNHRRSDAMPVLTDVQWSAIEPLIEAVRPQTGRELTNLRRTFEAIVWRMQNGAKWRAIPAELGPWWMAAQTFIRWSKLGVWERFFEAAKAAGRPALGMVFMDSTILRAHQKAAGAAKRGTPQPSHRARTTKRSAAARAALAPRPMPLPTRGAALWALPSRRGRQARRHKP